MEETKKCAGCGEDFSPRSRTHKYCSKDCVELAGLRRKESVRRADYYIFMRDDFKCLYCGKSPIEDGIRLLVDHVIPRVSGGGHGIYNLVTCCDDCNWGKLHRHLSPQVYQRVIDVITKKNGGITEEARAFVEMVFTKKYGIPPKEVGF